MLEHMSPMCHGTVCVICDMWNKCRKTDTVSAVADAALVLASTEESKGHGTLHSREQTKTESN